MYVGLMLLHFQEFFLSFKFHTRSFLKHSKRIRNERDLLHFHNIFYYAFLMHFLIFVYILCVCVYMIFFFYWLIHHYSHLPFVHVHVHLPFCFDVFSFQVIKVCPWLAQLHFHFKKYVKIVIWWVSSFFQ